MKVALVGLGYWGDKILRNLVGIVGAERVVAVDTLEERVRRAGDMYPAITRCSSVDEVWKDEEVRSVVIATPVDTHARLARQALERGRHVLVEKPLAASTAEAWEVVELGQDRGLTVMVGHTFLFSPRMEAVCAAIQRGQIGRVHYVTTSRLNLGLYRTDINVIWDLAPHDLSITLQVLDEYPLLVQTTAQCSVQPNVPDVAFISLTFPSGAIASLAVSWRSPRKVRNTMVVGEQGMIVYDDTQPEEPVKIYDRGVVSVESASFGENQLTYRYGDTIAPHVAPTEPLFLELQHFLRCVDEAGPCRSDGWFGLEVVKVLEAADRSWRLGGVPVAIEDTTRLRRSG